MSLSAHESLLVTVNRNLSALDKIVDKAAAHAQAKGFDVANLLGARLAPDMFSLTRQIQIATDLAKGAAARLSATPIPVYEDTETTVEELKQRIARTLAFVNGLDAAAFVGAETREVTVTVRDHEFKFSGSQYLLTWALPNFYFHVTASYLILRHNGVELGKRDFLGLV